MKALLALSMFLSFNASAAVTPALWIGNTKITASNVKQSNVDMYNFARQASKSFCYQGNAQTVISIISAILDIGTGDSDILDRNLTVTATKSISVKFNWYDEGGSHSTRKTVARCE